jgi:hypothetical protein
VVKSFRAVSAYRQRKKTAWIREEFNPFGVLGSGPQLFEALDPRAEMRTGSYKTSQSNTSGRVGTGDDFGACVGWQMPADAT